MLTTMRAIAPASLLAIGLAACQTVSLPGGGGSYTGQWASTDGIFIATLDEGQFTSRAVQSGETLAQGSYTVTGPDSLRLDWFSQTQNASLSANCVAANPGTLSCTPSRGTPFQLRRSTVG